MKTPIQELIDCFEEVASVTPDKIRKDAYETVLKQLRNVGLKKEKQFGLVCFEAGVEGGIDARKNDFDNFYKQYEQ